MGVTGWQRQEQRHQEDLQRLRGFRPIDDTFMRGLFKEIFHWQSLCFALLQENRI